MQDRESGGVLRGTAEPIVVRRMGYGSQEREAQMGRSRDAQKNVKKKAKRTMKEKQQAKREKRDQAAITL